MNLPQTLLFALFLLVCLPQKPLAQYKAFDPDKPPMEDMEMKVYELDSEANAVILYDAGVTRFVSSSNGFELLFRHHQVIKILNKEGYDHATMEIPLYHGDGKFEKLTAIKAFTYNLEGKKITKTELKSDEVFTENIGDNLKMTKFTFPAVTEGSVIEVVYSIRSDFLSHLRAWKFQQGIPSRQSQYRVVIPEYFSYKVMHTGYLPFAGFGNNETTESYFFPNQGEMKVKAMENYWSIVDIPAFRPEPYMTTTLDYLSRVDFELSRVQYPGSQAHEYMTDWKSFNTYMLESEYLGKHLKKSYQWEDLAAELTVGTAKAEEKARKIFEHVRNQMEWNGEKGTGGDRNLKKVYEDKSGSAAEINLILFSLLDAAGMEVAPVLLSTRNNGKVVKDLPLVSVFNYLVISFKYDDKTIFLDVTDPNAEFGHLPMFCLNGEGFVVDSDAWGWTELLREEKMLYIRQALLTLGIEGEVSGNLDFKSGKLAASAERADFRESGKEKFIQSSREDMDEWEVSEVTFSGFEENEGKTSLKYIVSGIDKAIVAGDKIYFNPMFGMGIDENPFRREKRMFPIDFGCPLKQIYRFSIVIPEGYELLEAPENANVILTGKSAQFRHILHLEGNMLQVMSTLSVNDVWFGPDSYQGLKDFFDMVVVKHSEQVVLTKKL